MGSIVVEREGGAGSTLGSIDLTAGSSEAFENLKAMTVRSMARPKLRRSATSQGGMYHTSVEMATKSIMGKTTECM